MGRDKSKISLGKLWKLEESLDMMIELLKP
jgi:hypothetical protein